MPPLFSRHCCYLIGAASFLLMPEVTPSAEAAEILQVEKTVTTGPWGTLEYYPVRLEPPTTQFLQSLFGKTTVWNFGVLTETGALAELRGIGFSEEILETLRAEGRWGRAKSGLEVTVPDSVVESITPDNRLALAEWFHSNNYDFFSRITVNIEGGDFSAFTEDKVRPEILELIKTHSFVRKGVLSFMDLPFIVRKIGDREEERETFIRTIFSTRALVVRLLIDETTDRAAIVDYWSWGERASRVESIVKGVQATMGVDKIDIVHLLPPLPRRYLYAFSRISDSSVHNTPDCFWASVHFFKRSPSPRVLDSLSIEHYLAHDFTEVSAEEKLHFGDIVCLLRPEDESFIHSYVHIADDIVFTKNGASNLHPFILTLKSDMMSLYPHEGECKVRVFRQIPGR
jgi:hypothetical protein